MDIIAQIDPAQLAQGFAFYLILVASIALHEWGHAYSADKLGDPLPRQQDRVTLNPMAHIDPIGTGLIPLSMIFLPILMGNDLPFALIGWGRPVQISLQGVKDKVKADVIITICGPLMNFVIAVATTIAAIAIFNIVGYNDKLYQLVTVTIVLNIALIVFNMIPIPPLDGSHLFRYLVNMKEETYMMLSQYGFIFLLILINSPLYYPFMFVIYTISGGFLGVIQQFLPA